MSICVQSCRPCLQKGSNRSFITRQVSSIKSTSYLDHVSPVACIDVLCMYVYECVLRSVGRGGCDDFTKK